MIEQPPGMYDPETGSGIRPAWWIAGAIGGLAIWALAGYGAWHLIAGCR